MSSVAGKTLADFPEILEQWHPTKNGDVEPRKIAGGSSKKYWWKCSVAEDHEWETKVNHRTSRKTRCPFCTGRKVVKSTSLAFHYPTVSQYWHLTKNGDLTPEQVSKSSNKKVWWRCTKDPGHVWQAHISNFVKRHKKNISLSLCIHCPKPIDKGHSLPEKFLKIAAQWHPTKNGKQTPGQFHSGSRKTVWWKCDEGTDHEWKTKIVSRTFRNTGCPFCSRSKVSITNSLATEYPHIAAEWHPTKNGELSPDMVVSQSDKQVWWQCPKKPGHEWKTRPNSRIRQKSGCPFCSRKISTKPTFHSVKGKTLSDFPKILKEWHYTKNGNVEPKGIVAGSNTKYWWKCPEGPDHEWETTTGSRTRGTGCPCCSTPPVKVSITNCLATLFPNVAKQWHPTKNENLTPDDVTAFSNKKRWWKCPEGPDHEWEAVTSSRTRGNSGCPFCRGIKASVTNSMASKFPELVSEWHPTKNGDATPEGIPAGTTKYFWWKCPEGPDHKWRARVSGRISGSGCPYCSGGKVSVTNSLASLSPEIAKEWHPTKNGELSPDKVTWGSRRKVWWKCDKGPDHEWETSISNRTTPVSSSKCPYCVGKKASVTNSLVSLYPEIAKEWHPSKNGELSPDKVTFGSRRKVWWKCDKGPDHEWTNTINSRTSMNTWCPFCAGQKLSVTNCLAIQYPELAIQWHPTKNGELRPEDVTVGTTKRVWWQCPRFTKHEWQVSVTSRIKPDYLSDCPHCNLIPRSKQEIRIAFELLSFFDFEITDHKAKVLGKIFDVDVRLDKPKLIIEFDGSYWHRDRMSNDIEKTKTLLKGGWKVIRIREDPLEIITTNDISVSQHCSVKEVMDLLLPTIEKVCNIKIDGLREYLRLKDRVNKKAAEEYIAKLLRDKEQTTLDVD